MVLEKEIDAPAPATTAAPLPYLGRSVRIVGDWQSVDATSTPHEKNKRSAATTTRSRKTRGASTS
jgi:hypothetical protein